jgi:hypothetical protein
MTNEHAQLLVSLRGLKEKEETTGYPYIADRASAPFTYGMAFYCAPNKRVFISTGMFFFVH